MNVKILAGLAEKQVLQRLRDRGAKAVLKGTAGECGPVLATILDGGDFLQDWKNRPVGKASRGRWKATLTGIPAGGPYQLRLEVGRDHALIASFYVGDVWLLAGQSNMEGVGQMSGAASPHPLVRVFSLRREWRLAEDPLHLLAESPDKCHHREQQCSPEEGEMKRRMNPKGVGVGLYFGREMVKRSGVPQGLICTAQGGTGMDAWSPERKHLGGESLYASMLASVQATGQPLAGVLWYQGESDANAKCAPEYTRRMEGFVAACRRALRQPCLPWMGVQIGRYFNAGTEFAPWNEIQEQQRLLPSRISHLEMVSAIDLPLDDSLHVGSDGFQVLAKRLARVADRMVHGKAREPRPPQLRTIRRLTTSSPWDCAIEVSYDGVVGKLRSKGEANGFMLMTPEGKPFPIIYKTTLHGDTVRLYADSRFIDGKRLSYGQGFFPICTIVDERNMALPVFGPLDF